MSILAIIGLALLAAAVYIGYQFFQTLKSDAAGLLAQAKVSAVTAETEVQTKVAVAEVEAEKVVANIKAKL